MEKAVSELEKRRGSFVLYTALSIARQWMCCQLWGSGTTGIGAVASCTVRQQRMTSLIPVGMVGRGVSRLTAFTRLELRR